MTNYYDHFFASHPDPMWIFDLETLAFLDVNDAALSDYGYSREEFLHLTLADVRPLEDVPLMRGSLVESQGRATTPSMWRHKKKDGTVFDVEVRTHPITFKGRKAKVATLHNISALTAARAQARNLEQRLQRKLNRISDGFYTLDRDWTITFVNQKACELSRRRAEDLLGRNIWSIYPSMQNSVFESEFKRAIADNQPVEFTDHASFGRWFEVRAFPTEDGLAVFFKDLSQQRRDESQIQLLEAAVAHINDIVIITEAAPLSEPGPRIVYVNEAFTRISGYARQEALGRSPRFLHGPDTGAAARVAMTDALKQKKPFRGELVNYTKSGDEYWVEMEIVPITGQQGIVTHFVAVQRDITARKRQERALAISEERFRIISQTTSDVIWDWDIVTDRVWWNDGLKSTFGYDPATLPEDSTLAIDGIDAKDRSRVKDAIYGAIAQGENSWTEEYGFTRADGTVAQVIERGFVIRSSDGKATRAVGTLVDVSDQRRLEAQLRQAQRLEAVGQLTGGVAHDFNNLLTVILGNAEMLAERLGNDPTLFQLADMTRIAAERGAELTNRLLSFARKQPLDPKAIDVRELLQSMDGLLRRSLGEQIDIEMLFETDVKRALIDAAQLESALLNLCINARDAMADGGRLTIETQSAWLDEEYASTNPDVTPGPYVMIAVSDTGTGMDAETIARAFEPFFTTKDVGKGSGLGLSMVYGFIRQSKGHVKIYSELGVGTTTRLYLPLAPEDAAAAQQVGTHQATQLGAERILVVEDDELVRTHVAATLGALGYEVTIARNGEEAIDLLKSPAAFDLLFTDVVMPGRIGGRQLADAAARIRPDLPVLFTSGYTENAIIHNGRLDAGVHLLQKPYRRQDLAEKVRMILDTSMPDSSGES